MPNRIDQIRSIPALLEASSRLLVLGIVVAVVASGCSSGSSDGNGAPVANAGPDQNVTTGTLVQLSGAGSSDPDGDTLTYSWSLSSAPAGSTATLSDTAATSPTLTPDLDGVYVASLTVNDGQVSSQPDAVTITSAAPANTPPVADAGPDQEVETGSVVQLSGAGSADADGDALSYNWSLSSTPSGSTAALSDPGARDPTLTVDVDGVYIASLTVNDGQADSPPDEVTITSTTSPNTQPSITNISIDPAQTLIGQATVVSWIATDPDAADSIACSLDVEGDGIDDYDFEDCRGLTTQAHAYPSGGQYLATVTVRDGRGGVDTVSRRVTVSGGTIGITLDEPGHDALVHPDLEIEGSVSSLFTLQSLTARMDDRMIDLGAASSTFSGSLSIDGLEEGGKVLVIEALDSNGESAFFYQRLTFDTLPGLIIRSPAAGTVGRPDISFDIECTDVLGCQQIEVLNLPLEFSTSGNVIVSGTERIDQTLDRSGFAGRQINLLVRATDTAGQSSTERIPTYIDASPRYQEVVSMPGPIMDVDETRILYLVPSNFSNRPAFRPDRLFIYDRVTEQHEEIPIPAETPLLYAPEGIFRYFEERYAVLTPTGAWFLAGIEQIESALENGTASATQSSLELYDYREGQVSSFGSCTTFMPFEVAGDFGAYHCGSGLFLVQFSTGSEQQIFDEPFRFDLTPEGVMALSRLGVFLYRDGTVSQLTGSDRETPKTDGDLVIYTGPSRSPVRYLYENGIETQLNSGVGPQGIRRLEIGYEVNGGWVAYNDLDDPQAKFEIWRRDPQGQSSLITASLTSDNLIERLTGEGEVMIYTVPSALPSSRILVDPAGNTSLLGNGMRRGTSVKLDGEWHVVIGRTLFRVD